MRQDALFWAAAQGHSEVVQLLLLHNAFVNAEDRYHSTPLFAAVRNEHKEVIEHIGALAGSDFDIRDGMGRTLLWWATRSGCAQIIDRIRQYTEKADIKIFESDVDMTRSAARADPRFRYCDVCTRNIYRSSAYYSCRFCYDFDICLECSETGVRCLDFSHKWTFHQPDGFT